MLLKQYQTLFIAYLQPQWPHLLLLTGLLIGTIGVQLGNPQILSQFIDSAQSGSSLQTLFILAALFLCIGLLNQVLVIITAYISGKLAWSTTNHMRNDLVAHCLQLDMSFHNTHTPGELIARTDEDVSTLTNLFSVFVLQVLINGLMLICILILFFLKAWQLGLAMFFYAVISLIIVQRTRKPMGAAWYASFLAKAELHGYIGEQITGIPDIRANGAVAYIMQRFYEKRRSTFLTEWRTHKIGATVSGLSDIFFICGSVGAFILGAVLFQARIVSLGTVYLIVTYTQLLLQPLQEITAQIDDLQSAGASLKRISELYEQKTVLQDGPGIALAEGAPSIQFENVSFAYEPDIWVLKDITFVLEPGEILGILGRTGSGKTTLARLLFRLYDLNEGTIRINGHSIGDARIAEIRKYIGMVTQEVQLFHASIRDNLTFFESDIADEQIVAVLQEIGLANWYHSLPDSLDTMVASGTGQEAGLSAGEAQLLAFARVFLQKPAIIVLDEASSRLDPATEHVIEQALDRLFAERTGIIIAHRLTTINRAHKILILEDGKIREYGSRHELLQDPTSHFNHLLQIGLEEKLA